MSDPSKSYHFEIVCNDENQAEHLKEMMNSFGVDAKIVQRKRTYVVYLKEGSQIVDILNVMETRGSDGTGECTHCERDAQFSEP